MTNTDKLMEEVKRYYSDNFDYISSDQPTLSILTNVARHFAQWGAEHLANSNDEVVINGHKVEYDKDKDAITMEAIPNDLEEAAWDCVLDSVDVNNPVLLPKYKELLTYLFIAVAKWQKEQMMQEAVEGWVAVDSDTVGNRRVTFFPKEPVRDLLTKYKYWAATRPNYESVRLNPNAFPNLKWEDEPIKVRIIIVKED